MILIFGGSYQGKLEYAKERFGFCDGDICDCAKTSGVDFKKPCIYHAEAFALECVESGEEARAYFESRANEWADSVIIADDISAGVVPIDPVMREWREATGRLVNYLSHEADEVVRLFCGIATVIKTKKAV